MRLKYTGLVAATLLPLASSVGRAQDTTGVGRDTLSLRALYADALRLDPRQRQFALAQRQTELRLRNIDAEHRPSLTVDGVAQYQSAVTEIPVHVPGVSIPTPPNDTYDAHLGAQQSLYDPTTRPRQAVERAQLAETQAGTRVALYGLRQEVTDAFFTAAMLEQRQAELDAAIVELSAQLRETVVRFREGAALPGDTATIAAAVLQRRQEAMQLSADRSAALARLSDLTGRSIGERQSLALVTDSGLVAKTIRGLDFLRARPEYRQFAATRDVLATQTSVESAANKPRVSAFGRMGVGRPGLDLLSRDVQSYWIAGIQVHWTPWTWGTTDRDREVTELQREIVATNEAAFTRGLQRSVEELVATIQRLDHTLALDDEIVDLRERIDRETRARLDEGVVTPAEYVDKRGDLLTARLTRIQHRVELAQARATLLTTLGVEEP